MPKKLLHHFVSYDFSSASKLSPNSVPNDTYFSLLWHLNNTGQSGGTAGMDLNVLTVWPYYTGAGVKVQIIDEGVDYRNADLAPNFDSADSRDVYGAQPYGLPTGNDAHGTFIAGIIAAKGNNGAGTTGV